MASSSLNPLEYYACQGQISDPGSYAARLDELPADIPSLVRAIQGLMVHLHWAENYGLKLNKLRKTEANLRTVRDRLDKILALNDRPLDEPRELTQRTVGTCRDYSLFLAAAFRHRDIPARARCGFGTYFTKGRFEDHWICEVWQADEERWRLVDGQLDELQIETLKVDFDTLDLPQTKFVTGSQAWQRCRAKRVDPNRFGIFRMKGLDFVKGNMIRDFLALNKVEILPWDNFGPIGKSFIKMDKNELAQMDRLALVGSGEARDFVLQRAAFISNRELLLPSYFFEN
jgi:hypothetical protein